MKQERRTKKRSRIDAQAQFSAYAGPLVDEALAQAARLDAGAEGLHRLRVALRRLRSLLWAYRPLLARDFDERERAFLRHAATLAGQTRDWDIAIALLEAQRDGLAGARLHAARAAALASSVEQLAATDLRHALRDLLHGVNRALNTSPRRERFDTFARRRVRKARRALRERMRRAARSGRDDYAAWHDVRKAAKKLRYLLEFFGPVLPRGEMRRVKLLKRIQKRFGTLNDVVASEALLAGRSDVFDDRADAAAAHEVLAQLRKTRGRAAAKLLTR